MQSSGFFVGTAGGTVGGWDVMAAERPDREPLDGARRPALY